MEKIVTHTEDKFLCKYYYEKDDWIDHIVRAMDVEKNVEKYNTNA